VSVSTKIGLLAAEAAVVNMVDCFPAGDEITNGDVDARLLEERGRRCLAERGRSNRPPLFRLLFSGGTIVVQQAISIYSVCLPTTEKLFYRLSMI